MPEPGRLPAIEDFYINNESVHLQTFRLRDVPASIKFSNFKGKIFDLNLNN